MVGPQDGSQILSPQDHQVEGEGRAGAKAKPAKKARPKQTIAISHHREEDFKADGLRTYAQYRDLGIADATHGLAQAHVIRLQRPVQSGGSFKTAFTTTSNSRWSTCSRAG